MTSILMNPLCLKMNITKYALCHIFNALLHIT